MPTLSVVRLVALCVAAWLVISPVCAIAQSPSVQTYTSLTDWQSAVAAEHVTAIKLPKKGKTLSFVTNPVKIGGLTFQQVGSDPLGSFRNFVQATPFEFPDNDGNTNVALYTKYGVTSVSITPNSAISGFATDLFVIYPSEQDNLILYAADGSVIATVPVPSTTGFFGIVVTPQKSVKTMQFVSQTQVPDPSIGQGFSLENIVLSR